ncbi:hypothetical protein EDB89DRAFT_1954017 [Lactarius sanguifluus]|nr:hypothetical protein EDB89DRAFT_1954017 [Lactarius sanguifluus]
MGASQSKADNEQVFYNPVPIQVSPELASQLSDATLSSDVSPARQAVLDASVRAKIIAEAARLHEGDDHGDVKNSTALLGDLEEVRQKVDRYRKASEAVASCYRCVSPCYRVAGRKDSI